LRQKVKQGIDYTLLCLKIQQKNHTKKISKRFNPDYALKKVAWAFLPVMPIIAGRNARTTFYYPNA